jgi:hypothetical protein
MKIALFKVDGLPIPVVLNGLLYASFFMKMSSTRTLRTNAILRMGEATDAKK